MQDANAIGVWPTYWKAINGDQTQVHDPLIRSPTTTMPRLSHKTQGRSHVPEPRALNPCRAAEIPLVAQTIKHRASASTRQFIGNDIFTDSNKETRRHMYDGPDELISHMSATNYKRVLLAPTATIQYPVSRLPASTSTKLRIHHQQVSKIVKLRCR